MSDLESLSSPLSFTFTFSSITTDVLEYIALCDFGVCKTMFLAIPELGRRLFNRNYSNNLLKRFIVMTNSIDEELRRKLLISHEPCFVSYLPNYKLHSIDNQPAMTHLDGTQYWCFNGKKHRDSDQPAIIYSCGIQKWFFKGELHRGNDQPALIYPDGIQKWYFEDKLHRENDQPAVIYYNGIQEWYFEGKLHRENDQPAVIYPDGTQYWYINGEKHRGNDQPAIIHPDGTQCWYINGKFQKIITQNEIQ